MPDGNVMVCTAGVAAGSGGDATNPGGDAMTGRSGGMTPSVECKDPNKGLVSASFLILTVKFQSLPLSFDDSVDSIVSETSTFGCS
jgi:hypothetical protein